MARPATARKAGAWATLWNLFFVPTPYVLGIFAVVLLPVNILVHAVCYDGNMGESQKITVNVPREVLAEARRITGKGITATIMDGLRELQRANKRSALRRLGGKVRFELDLENTRR